jgi:hypothetical protein
MHLIAAYDGLKRRFAPSGAGIMAVEQFGALFAPRVNNTFIAPVRASLRYAISTADSYRWIYDA